MKQMKSILILIIGLLGLSGQYIAGEEAESIRSFSLAEVCEYAVKHSTSTTNARLDVLAARKKIWETTATGLPQINAKIDFQDMIQMPTTLIPAEFFKEDAEPGTFEEVTFGTQYNTNIDVTLSQLVFSGSYFVALQASRTYLRLLQNSRDKSEINVKETVTNTYYLVLLAEDSHQTLSASLENLRKTLDETRELHKAGFVEDTDVDQVQLAVTDLENSTRSMERQIAVTYRLLKFQMGYDLNKKIRLSENLDTIMKQVESKHLLKEPFKLEKHIDFKTLITQEKAQHLLLKNEKTAYLPTISAYITHRESAMRDRFDIFKKGGKWFPTTIVGVTIDIPIFSSGMRGAKVAQAKLELKKIRNQKGEASKGLQLELLQARSAFADAVDKTAATRQNTRLAKKIFEKTRVKYTEGISSSLDLIQVHNQYLTAESNYTRAAVDLLQARTRLDKVLSRL